MEADVMCESMEGIDMGAGHHWYKCGKEKGEGCRWTAILRQDRQEDDVTKRNKPFTENWLERDRHSFIHPILSVCCIPGTDRHFKKKQ